jgi:hypothetical protein
MAIFNLSAMARTRPEHGEGMARAWMPELRQCMEQLPDARVEAMPEQWPDGRTRIGHTGAWFA